MEPLELVGKYLRQRQIMQLATVRGGQPWVCNLHYAVDDDNVLYWLSSAGRRHSRELQDDPKAAAAIAVKSPDHPVVGIQIEGDGRVVEDPKELQEKLKLYNARHKLSEDFYDGVLKGTSSYNLYKLVPRAIVLFDEENFPDSPRQEIETGVK